MGRQRITEVQAESPVVHGVDETRSVSFASRRNSVPADSSEIFDFRNTRTLRVLGTGLTPPRSCHSHSCGGLPEFPGRETRFSTAPELRSDFSRGDKSGADSEPLRHVPAQPDANGETVRAEYPAVERRTGFVASKHPARPGRKAALTRLYALERTSGVVTGRQPSNAPRESVLEGRGNAQP